MTTYYKYKHNCVKGSEPSISQPGSRPVTPPELKIVEKINRYDQCSISTMYNMWPN